MTFNMIMWSALLLVTLIFSAITRKNAADYLSPETGPIMNCLWVFIGLFFTFPLFEKEWKFAYEALRDNNWIIIPIIFKGFLFYYANIARMKLVKDSLSASNFIGPAALSVSPFILMLLGEKLTLPQLIVSVGLGLVGIAFFLFGHVSELNKQNKLRFIKLSIVAIGMIVVDFIVIDYANWVVLLLGTAVIQTIIAFTQKYPISIWKEAVMTKYAIYTGITFCIAEFVLFYQMGTITPVSVAVAVKAGAIPFVQLAASIIWKERKWQEQVSWGMATTILFIVLAYTK